MVPTPYNAHVLGILILNALLLGGVMKLLHAHHRSVVVAGAGLAAILLVVSREPSVLTSSWMPDTYVAPFLLFTTAAASFLAGRWKTVPWLALGGGLLIHGHISFAGFVLPTLAVLIVVSLARSWGKVRDTLRRERRPLGLAAGILAAFALPIVVNLALHWPGEFGRYVHYLRSGQAGKHKLAAVVHYASIYWAGGPSHRLVIAGLVMAALAAVFSERDAKARRFSAWLLATCGLMTLLFVNYGLRGIDNLTERYIGLFYASVPALMSAVIVMAVVRRVRGATPRAVAVVPSVAVAVMWVAWAVSAQLLIPFQGESRLPPILAQLRSSDAGRSGTWAVSFPTETWPLTVGLMYYGTHHGQRICASNGFWALLVTQSFVCSPAERQHATTFDILPVAQPHTGSDVFADREVVISRRPTP